MFSWPLTSLLKAIKGKQVTKGFVISRSAQWKRFYLDTCFASLTQVS